MSYPDPPQKEIGAKTLYFSQSTLLKRSRMKQGDVKKFIHRRTRSTR